MNKIDNWLVNYGYIPIGLIGLGLVVFFIWVIIKLMQYFNII